METLYLVESYVNTDYEEDLHINNVGVYSTLEKAIKAGNTYMRRQIERLLNFQSLGEAKENPRYANRETNYDEITLDNWEEYRRYEYVSEFDYSKIEIIKRKLDGEPIC